MELQTISQVSKKYGISTRMLRYYEQIGLIKSLRKKDYSYRVYDEFALKCLQQVIVLRKLQIPVRQICMLLNNPDAAMVIDIFKKNISELENEITALSTIKSILSRFVDELEEIAAVHLNLDLLNDDSVLKLAESLSLVQKNIKESFTMKDLSKADRQLLKLQDVRIVYLPPMTVASSHYVGENPEANAGKVLDEFVRKSDLLKIKPDLRHIGFDNPAGNPNSGYEMWVSIPEDMEVAPPLLKKQFRGGLYAAHAIKIGDFDRWLDLQDWVNESEKYQSDANSIRCTPHTKGLNGYLEERLNYFHNVQDPEYDGGALQLDLLLPVKPVESAEEAPIEIEGSIEKCGCKASLVAKNKFTIMGFTTFITPEKGDDAVQDFWKAAKADGYLDIIQKYKKPGAPVLGFGSYDSACRKHNGWRYTICLSESDITDVKAFKAHDLFIRKIDASKWVCFDMTKEKSIGFNPHTGAPKLGHKFNGPISGVFTVYPDGSTGILDRNSKADMESVIYCWFPVK